MHPPTHKSIAILLDYLGAEMGTYIGGYQGSVFSGIRAELSRRGLPWTTYIGRSLKDSEQNSAYRTASDLYSLIDPERHSGMLVLTPAIGTHLGDDELRQFLQHYHPLPMVGMGRKVQGIPTVLVDNTQGMREMMRHLLEVRGFRKFVFVRGITQHHDARVREEVFLEELALRGIEVPPDHLLNGDFHSARAYSAMRTLLNRKGDWIQNRDMECVVCANDEMAFGVMQALQDHGIRVPTQVAVVGFDDIAEARVRIPPLTTIRQPLFEMGEEAVRLLLDPPPGTEDVYLGSKLVVRQSCGEIPEFQPAQESVKDPAIEELYGALYRAALDPAERPHFTTLWYDRLLETVSRGDPLDLLKGQLMHMQLKAQEELPPAALAGLVQVALEGQSLLFDLQKVSQSRSYFGYTLTMIYQMRLDAQLMSHHSFEPLLQDMERYLDWLEVERYVVVLYDQFGPSPAQTAHVVLASGVGEVDPASFPTRQLLPDSMQNALQAHSWFAMPLFINDEHYGILLMGKHTKFNLDGDMPRYLLSRALSQVVKSQARKQYTESLEQQVAERTRELQQEVAVRTRAEKALRIANKELKRSVLLDGLTGIFNRTAFNEHLERTWKRHLREGHPLALILCDVDFFKRYNDLYGHLQGDECLKQVAHTLERCARNLEDMAARYGGEEFALILPQTDLYGALRVAQRLQDELEGLNLKHEGSGVAPRVTLSMGLAHGVPSAAWSPRTLIQWADEALYRAKGAGRNQVAVSMSCPSHPV